MVDESRAPRLPRADHLDELRFQLLVTTAMLGTLDLDRILYIILSGVTHGEGLDFNRAILFLPDPGHGLRASRAVGPASGEEAHLIWEAMEEASLDLEMLLADYERTRSDPMAQSLMRAVLDLRADPLAVPNPVDPASCPPEATLALCDVVAHCVQRRRPYWSNTQSLRADTDNGAPLVFTPFAVVPLVAEDAVRGVVVADNAFNQRLIERADMTGLGTLCNMAAIAIDRAFLHERLRELADQDGLTGVSNRRHYEVRLAEELARARRADASLSLLVLDLDHFKVCNDTWGHETGDCVLRGIARFLRDNVRAQDVVARYGGEEFIVILTDGAGPDQALAVAEKLRSCIAETRWCGLPPGTITISVGVAAARGEALDAQALFRAADQALYLAKGRGRNRAELDTGAAIRVSRSSTDDPHAGER